MSHGAEASTSGPLQGKVKITNPQGLHLRPMRDFVELATQFQSQVRVTRNGLEGPVDGKSIMSLMLLGAEQGTELTVEVSGPDAQTALAALVELLANLDTTEEVESPD